jgi:hypothetical protein
MTHLAVRFTQWTAAVALVLGVPAVLAAQDTTTYQNHLYDKFQATADFTTVVNRSNARFDGRDGSLGTDINFRDLLGVSSTTVQPALGISWKPGRHTELGVGYQFINQNGSRTLGDDIVIGDDTVSANFDATTKTSANNANLTFRYSVWAAERHMIGLELGLGAIFFDLQLDATAHGCVGTACDSGAVSIKKNATAPTGALGVFGVWRLGNRWYVGGDARGIGAKVDRYDISVFQADATARYFLSNRWGIGAGWYYNNVTVDIAPKSGGQLPGDVAGKFTFKYTSLRLGIVYAL